MAARRRRRLRPVFAQFELTDNSHFFTELAQHIIKAMSFLGPLGRLYQLDMRLRPTGRSGSLVTPLNEFRHYFALECVHPEGCAPIVGAAGINAGAGVCTAMPTLVVW